MRITKEILLPFWPNVYIFFALSPYLPRRKLTANLPATWPPTLARLLVARRGERFATQLQQKSASVQPATVHSPSLFVRILPREIRCRGYGWGGWQRNEF